jgi:hypothetical protein
MIRFYAFSGYERDSTQSASVSLLLVQSQPLFRVGFPSHLLLLALCPVLAQGWVVGRTSSFDLGEAGNQGCVGLDQLCLLFPECPGAVAPEIACFHPFTAFVRVSAFRPGPEHLPLGVSGFLEDVFGCAVPVVIRPSPYDGVECLNDVPCRGVLVCVQVGSECPQVFEDFFLLWDGQHFALLPEFPDVKPQEVHPFRDVHDPGFGFTEGQTSFLKKLLYPWSGIGFQYLPCWGRDHKVIGIASDCYASIAAFATGWGFGAPICVFCVEQPFHPIQCHIRQQWGNYTSYKVANLPIEFSTSIPRTQLRPGYGDGFLGAPLQSVPSYERPSPRRQGGQRGTSRTHRQHTPGGAHHI